MCTDCLELEAPERHRFRGASPEPTHLPEQGTSTRTWGHKSPPGRFTTMRNDSYHRRALEGGPTPRETLSSAVTTPSTHPLRVPQLPWRPCAPLRGACNPHPFPYSDCVQTLKSHHTLGYVLVFPRDTHAHGIKLCAFVCLISCHHCGPSRGT